MTNAIYSLWSILDNYEIEIPMIQRDYAQGREESKIPYIRENILRSIHKSLDDSSRRLDFDFVYGKIEKTNKGEKLVPIDGQQRLTTLFLIHWYLAVKEGAPCQEYEKLNRFKYNTRKTAELFCTNLIKNGEYSKEAGQTVDEQIKDSSWFIMSWEKDPTVHAMLVMLKGIEKEFINSNIPYFKKMIDTESPPVYFHFNDMKLLQLDDDTYIKMNSRGKQLTEFENFKSRFEQYLQDNDSLSVEHKEFSGKIDSVWTDFFWQHNSYKLFDEAFMNFTIFILEIIHYKQFIDNENLFTPFKIDVNDPDFWKPYLIKKVNIEFYIKALDTVTSWGSSETYFGSFLGKNVYHEGKICLFSDEVDLLSCCTKKKGFTIREKILLYFCLIISPRLNMNELENGEFHRRFRILRNLLQYVRQIKWPVFDNNLRYEFFQRYINDAEIIANYHGFIDTWLQNGATLSGLNAYIPFEKQKSETRKNIFVQKTLDSVEDDPLFKGLIHNICNDLSNDELSIIYAILKKTWENVDTIVIIKALIAFGFDGADMGYSGLGERWFWGSSDNWETVLTSEVEKCKGLNLVKFLKSINAQLLSGKEIPNILEDIIELKKSEYDGSRTKDWRYYFLHYPEMLGLEECQFSWVNDFEVRRLTTKTARGYHINPYVYTVSIRMLTKGSIIVKGNNSYGLGNDPTPLILTNGINMFCEAEGWLITKRDGCTVDFSRIQSLEILPNGEYILRDTDTNDRIQIAEIFIANLEESKI